MSSGITRSEVLGVNCQDLLLLNEQLRHLSNCYRACQHVDKIPHASVSRLGERCPTLRDQVGYHLPLKGGVLACIQQLYVQVGCAIVWRVNPWSTRRKSENYGATRRLGCVKQMDPARVKARPPIAGSKLYKKYEKKLET